MPIIANGKQYIIKANGKYYDIYNPFAIFTFTINPTPADSSVVLTATGYTQIGNTITVEKGTSVSWSVSKSGYITQSGSQVVNSDETKSIELEEEFTPETRTFNYTGAVQTYTIPNGCTKLIVDAVGARGGNVINYSNSGGKGGRVQCKLSVTAGQTLNIYIGGAGTNMIETIETTEYAGGWNGGGKGCGTYLFGFSGGGAGGGATDIRVGGTEFINRVVVAAAGGGAGYLYDTTEYILNGGAGGGLIGGNGTPFNSSSVGAGGGTQSSGGAGGGSSGDASRRGYAGDIGCGGDGKYGAGGGAGYYGGGGGYTNLCSAGGGSSYTDPTLCTDVVHTQGYSAATGNGWLTITTSK